ncbi:cryptochrome/photolyase family protein [Arthrobacter bambusae]|uniref:cryptochrome/photolyase family protein n=1 Tax=Arthrobacter bambusae TaxID=1338426 RepID=UPI00277F6143|nr:deoxyribodipyrimidine photo-lyase [Arthrobacter bambusae]MDQ0030607.1 deoxyribodipyrimidine photo-lyase [Arthrobacter bambusae]MDQ0099106.1 deoxyribodipyrimidine photo-lyase [Arthrobacter bambusae]
MKPSIVWFRDDLRTADNPALRAAADDGAAVALYVFDEESPGIRPPGGASRWWLHHSLLALRDDLACLGVPLLLRRGPAAEVIRETATAMGSGSLYWNRRYGGAERTLDAGIKAWARESGMHAESFQASLLHEPLDVTTKQGGPFKVFTPFWRTVSGMDFREPLEAPEPGRGFSGQLPESEDLDTWGLLPRNPDWSGGLSESWQPGPVQAHEFLDDFVEHGIADYSVNRDRPDLPGSSRLSPFLRWGQLSPFEVWHALQGRRRELGDGAAVFASELGWREFCWHQYFHHPDLATANLRPGFDHYPWAWPRAEAGSPETQDAADLLRAWQEGRTGFPLVDAGQRQLWHLGWMHNRVRMVSASLLVKNLGIHWQVGEQWFWDTLVDADPASNPANWQWVAGSGADASPFFRIFNPETQAAKFDPDGRYVGKWIPELSTADYPDPVVDLKASRREALDAFGSLPR